MSTQQTKLAKVFLGDWAPAYYKNKEWTMTGIEGEEYILEWEDGGYMGNGRIYAGNHWIKIAWNPKNNTIKELGDCCEE